jgi:hypothetical protein
MATIKKGILGFLITCSLAGCNQDADQVKEVESEVLTIHDEVMPKMDDIMRLQKRLNDKMGHLDSLQQEGVSSTTMAQVRVKATELKQQLSTADSLMMEWMYLYRGDSAKALPAGEALRYFNQQKEKLSQVKEQTNKSIQATEEFLK